MTRYLTQRGATHRTGGFTLIELVVALGIFAVMSSIAFGAIRTVINTRAAVSESNQQFAMVQMFFSYMEEDLENALERAVRDELGGEEASLAGFGDERLLSLTRGGGYLLPGNDAPASNLRRIEYELEEGSVGRYSWSVLDRSTVSERRGGQLLAGIAEIGMRFMNAGGDWLEVWPPAARATLPRAVQVELQLEDGRSYRRLFAVPAGAAR
ncbi:MAG: type II secretion system minor pseudopilin GspJ [Gammaproteobacteria bacterium]|nr:type II secretion system minor pseudopilin GspJ [Gammaproteobacteria bacterium]